MMPFRGNKLPSRDRFEKFTERARTVLALAQEEAQRLGHPYIGTEHLLLGLVREGDGVAGKVLQSLDVDLARVRDSVEHIIRRSDREVHGEIGLTPRAKKVVELAVDEARRMGHRYIGTEHLLLGIVREGEGIGASVLQGLGLRLEDLRSRVLQELVRHGTDTAARPEPPSGNGPKTNVVTCRLDDRTLDAVDALVEAGIRPTRSDAAAWLIATGLEANRPLIDRVYATVTEIRRLRQEARTLAHDAAPAAEEPAPPDAAPPANAPAEDGHEVEGDAGPDDAPTEPA